MGSEQQQHEGDGRALTSRENGLKGGATNDRSLSRYNGTRHGILSAEVVIARLGECEEDYAALREAVLAELPDLQRAVHPAPGWRHR